MYLLGTLFYFILYKSNHHNTQHHISSASLSSPPSVILQRTIHDKYPSEPLVCFIQFLTILDTATPPIPTPFHPHLHWHYCWELILELVVANEQTFDLRLDDLVPKHTLEKMTYFFWARLLWMSPCHHLLDRTFLTLVLDQEDVSSIQVASHIVSFSPTMVVVWVRYLYPYPSLVLLSKTHSMVDLGWMVLMLDHNVDDIFLVLA